MASQSTMEVPGTLVVIPSTDRGYELFAVAPTGMEREEIDRIVSEVIDTLRKEDEAAGRTDTGEDYDGSDVDKRLQERGFLTFSTVHNARTIWD